MYNIELYWCIVQIIEPNWAKGKTLSHWAKLSMRQNIEPFWCLMHSIEPRIDAWYMALSHGCTALSHNYYWCMMHRYWAIWCLMHSRAILSHTDAWCTALRHIEAWYTALSFIDACYMGSHKMKGADIVLYTVAFPGDSISLRKRLIQHVHIMAFLTTISLRKRWIQRIQNTSWVIWYHPGSVLSNGSF